MQRKLYDTNVLLDNPHLILEIEDKSDILISWTTLRELDGLKDRNYKAREVIRVLDKFKDEINFVGEDKNYSNDDTIISDAGEQHEAILVTNDILMNIKASNRGVPTEKYLNKMNDVSKYDNPRTIYFSEEETANYFQTKEIEINSDEPYILAACEADNKIFSAFKKVNGEYVEFDMNNFNDCGVSSAELGPLYPKDIYQKIALDSLKNNQMTILTGKAGTGKTLLSLAYIMNALNSGQYNRVVIFTNPIKVRDTVDLGAYKGDRGDKILQQSIGAMLGSKFGDILGVEYLLESGKMAIYPFSDVRGIEVKNDEILYMPEMQNSSIDLAKLGIQRAAEKTKIVVEGDMDTQVDMSQFEGSNNGLRRYVEVLHGKPGVCHIHLPINYRSKVSSWAEEM